MGTPAVETPGAATPGRPEDAPEPETGDLPEAGDADELEPPATDHDHPEPEGGMSEKELERAMAKLESEASRHAGRVGEIMGEDANDLVRCELCEPHIPGFRFPVEPDEERTAAVLVALGLAGDGAFEKADDTRLCEKCNGLGAVVTGSHVPAHLTKVCAACRGAGYVDVGGPQTPALAVVPPGTAPDVAPPAEPVPDEDPWGRRRGDPDFGRLPGYEPTP